MKMLRNVFAALVMMFALSVFASAMPFATVSERSSLEVSASELLTPALNLKTTCTDTNDTLAGRVEQWKVGRNGGITVEQVTGIAIGAFPSGGGAMVAYGLSDSLGYYSITGLQPCTTYVLQYSYSNTTNPSYGINSYTVPNSRTVNTDISAGIGGHPFYQSFVIYQF